MARKTDTFVYLSKVDVAIVTAVNSAALLNKHIATHCPTGGTPLDNWRRSMNEVRKRADGELPEDSGSDDANENEKSSEFFAAAVRAVRCAYADEICRLDVPSSALEVAALAHHLRRPITLIRGPCVTEKDNIRKPCDESSDDSPGRARCFSETFGERFRDDGREGFTLFWELAANVPCGLPAGDFSLLLPTRPKVPEGTRSVSRSYGSLTNPCVNNAFVEKEAPDFPSYDSDDSFASYDETNASVTSDLFRDDLSRGDTDTDDDDDDASDVSVDDLVRGHLEREASRQKKSDHWSDATPNGSEAEASDFSDPDVSDNNNSLWNSDSERSFMGSESDVSGDGDADGQYDSREPRVPSFMR